MHLLFSAELYLRVATVTLFVNADVLFAAGTSGVVDVDLVSFKSSISPSDARGTTLLDFALYPGSGSGFLGSSVTPVRRREDTDWNGDTGVKVQIVWIGASQLSNPFRGKADESQDLGVWILEGNLRAQGRQRNEMC